MTSYFFLLLFFTLTAVVGLGCGASLDTTATVVDAGKPLKRKEGPSSGRRCQWTRWVSAIKSHLSFDYKTMEDLQAIYGFCPDAVDIQCRDKRKKTMANEENLICSLTFGLRCEKSMCEDLRMRVKCCYDDPPKPVGPVFLLTSVQTGRCLQSHGLRERSVNVTSSVEVARCDSRLLRQMWAWASHDRLVNMWTGRCLTITTLPRPRLSTADCTLRSDDLKWRTDYGTLFHSATQRFACEKGGRSVVTRKAKTFWRATATLQSLNSIFT